MLRNKSVYSPIDRGRDGLRLLVTRYRGRGLKRTRYDTWMPNLAPSETLLAQISNDEITWAKFAREYRTELFSDGPIDAKCKTIKNHNQKFNLRLIKRLAKKGNVTLMCHCSEDEQRCHRHLLTKLILSSRV